MSVEISFVFSSTSYFYCGWNSETWIKVLLDRSAFSRPISSTVLHIPGQWYSGNVSVQLSVVLCAVRNTNVVLTFTHCDRSVCMYSALIDLFIFLLLCAITCVSLENIVYCLIPTSWGSGGKCNGYSILVLFWVLSITRHIASSWVGSFSLLRLGGVLCEITLITIPRHPAVMQNQKISLFSTKKKTYQCLLRQIIIISLFLSLFLDFDCPPALRLLKIVISISRKSQVKHNIPSKHSGDVYWIKPFPINEPLISCIQNIQSACRARKLISYRFGIN